MKILYEHQIFSQQRYGGISRYFFELMSEYEKNTEISYQLSLKATDNAYLRGSKIFKEIKRGENPEDFFRGLNFKGSKALHKIFAHLGLSQEQMFLNKKESIKTIKGGDFDILHPTYYDPYFLKYLAGKPFVLTVHDMIHEIYLNKYFKKSDPVLKRKNFLALKADRIIAVSENTKIDIMKFYNIEGGKIDVVHHGSSLEYKKSKENYSLPNKYILFVGDRHFYKNFIFFLNSLQPLLKSDPNLHILCVGSKPFNEDEVSLLKALKINKQVIHKPIENDEMLAQSYYNALCFVFPTLYEGFGIPILEAFSCDCPAVLSNTSSLPEVAADAAVFFDPEDENSLRDSVGDLIYNQNLRTEFILKGRQRLKSFSWKKCALETKKVYEKVLD